MCRQQFKIFLLLFLNYFLLRGKFCVISAASLNGDSDLFVWGAVEDDNDNNAKEVGIGSRFGEAGINNSEEKDVNTTVIELFNNCLCVIYYQCDDDNFIITDGSGIFDLRAGGDVERINCPKKGHVCCRRREKGEGTEKDPEVRHPPPITTSSERPELSTVPGSDDYQCGQQRPAFNVRIFVDDDEYGATIDGEFPWMAAVYRLKRNSNREYDFKCGGSLIHERVVMTAMHCVKGVKTDDIKVLVNGMNKLTDIGENVKFERNVEEVIKHPDYYAGAAYNDVALLVLDEGYNISTALINSVCLPKQNENFDGTRCITAGWGRGNNAGNNNLKKVEVPMVERSECQRLLRQTRLGASFELHESFVCAGGEEGNDACQGDGGGPLVCPFDNKNRYVQVGIISWGIGCAEKDVPGVYANVAMFHQWIQDELSNRGIFLN